jgi:hypothetical protein
MAFTKRRGIRCASVRSPLLQKVGPQVQAALVHLSFSVNLAARPAPRTELPLEGRTDRGEADAAPLSEQHWF